MSFYIKTLKHLFAPISAFHVYAVRYEVYHHPPFELIGLHRIWCKCQFINFNQYNTNLHIGFAFFVATYCFVTPFRKAKFCGVPSRAIVKVWCAVGVKRLRNTGEEQCF
jgi:hypothetical protein